MTRKELYATIKEFGLQDIIKETFGANFTNVSTENLMNVVEAFNKKKAKTKAPKVAKKPMPEPEETSEDCVPLKKIFEAVDKLLVVLKKKHILLKSELDYIIGDD